jgi:type IV secretion system protein VirB10
MSEPAVEIGRGLPGVVQRKTAPRFQVLLVVIAVIVVICTGAWMTVTRFMAHRAEASAMKSAMQAQLDGGDGKSKPAFNDAPRPISEAHPPAFSSSTIESENVPPLPAGPLPAAPLAEAPSAPYSGGVQQGPVGPPVKSYLDSPLIVENGVRSSGAPSSGAAAPSAAPSQPSTAAGSLGPAFSPNSGLPAPERPQNAFAAMLAATATPKASASFLGNRNFILAKGTTMDCVLKPALDSSVPGMTGCIVTKNVYSDNGKVVLLERGSECTGEFVSALRNGQKRLFVLWTRIKTPHGVVIALDSPAADALGRSGIKGDIDNHWFERIGAAFLLSFIEDSVALVAARESSTSGTLEFQNTQQTGQSMAGKVLDATINIAPTLTRNQGERVSIYVARDLDFEKVYGLEPN